MLTLILKKKWFEMIISEEKKEEYREIKPYYTKRFTNVWGEDLENTKELKPIAFRQGYKKDAPRFVAYCSIKIGEGKSKWGATANENYYVLTIHKIEK